MNLGFLVAALACSFGLPRRLAGAGGNEAATADDARDGDGEAQENAARPGTAASVREH